MDCRAGADQCIVFSMPVRIDFPFLMFVVYGDLVALGDGSVRGVRDFATRHLDWQRIGPRTTKNLQIKLLVADSM